MHRREFLWTGAVAATAVATGSVAVGASPREAPIALFTDHLDDLGLTYEEVAKHLALLKIAGPDLTVRPGGLVPPEKVAEELPKAAAVFKEHGLSIPMVSTALTSPRDPAAQPTFVAMAKAGIKYYKLGYYSYDDVTQWETRLAETRRDLTGLLNLSQPAGLVAGLHNHAGSSVGGALWDGWELLAPLDARAVGFYFDPAQATIEGSKHAWKLNFQRAMPRLAMIAIKDFVWEKSGGKWQTRWCPLGEGMVNWPEFVALLAKANLPGPISLHIEYDPGGKTKVERLENCLAAAQRDLAFLRKQLG